MVRPEGAAINRRGIWITRPVLAWAAYDWANSAFALTVITAFVPVMLAEFWNDGAASSVTTFRLGVASSIASLLVAVSAPLLGAMADRAGRRKGYLLTFAVLGMVMTGALFFVAEGWWPVALFCYVIASIGFAGGNTFYDSLLTAVTPADHYDQVSAFAYGAGYFGGALLFLFNVIMVGNPEWFGLPTAFDAIRVAFLLVAAWWALFTVPVLLWVREPPATPGRGDLAGGLRELAGTLRDIGAQREIVIFLFAYWLYIDGVDTIIRMAGNYGLAIGLTRNQVIQALLLANFVGFPAAVFFGWFGRHHGTRNGIYIGLCGYIVATGYAVFIDTAFEFYALAVLIGLIQGGVQSLSRSFFARLIPAGKTAEYFGFYNMLGKFAAVIGPALTGIVALMTGSQRLGILSILVLFVSGFWLLTRVSPSAGSPAQTH